jgi:hypothetical protein
MIPRRSPFAGTLVSILSPLRHHRACSEAPVVGKLLPHAAETIKVSHTISHSTFFEQSLQRTRAGELSIGPRQGQADWYRWLENIQDWCTPRQLSWGHQCPAYFVQLEGEAIDVRTSTISLTLAHLLLNPEKWSKELGCGSDSRRSN